MNIGNPEEWTILECAREILEVTGSASRIRFEPLPEDDPVQRQAGHHEGEAAAGVGAEDRSEDGVEVVSGVFSAIGGAGREGRRGRSVPRRRWSLMGYRGRRTDYGTGAAAT